MKIKSLEELKRIREENIDKVSLRDCGEAEGDKVEVLIGMSTCGISSGARDTLNTFVEQCAKEKLTQVRVVPVGCIGYCHSEPTVQVNMAGQRPVIYGNVKKDKVNEIIESHIKAGKPVESLILNVDFDRA